MNKQINRINGYVVVCKFKFKCNSMIFLLKNFQNVIKERVTCLRTHFYNPHPKILYETLLCVVEWGEKL